MKCWALVALMLALAAGCATDHSLPPGYDADTTPGRDGADWIGGAP